MCKRGVFTSAAGEPACSKEVLRRLEARLEAATRSLVGVRVRARTGSDCRSSAIGTRGSEAHLPRGGHDLIWYPAISLSRIAYVYLRGGKRHVAGGVGGAVSRQLEVG